MSIQKLHPFEKTAIQVRHTIKRLEVVLETSRNAEEIEIAKEMLSKFQKIKSMIPEEYHDVDIREKE